MATVVGRDDLWTRLLADLSPLLIVALVPLAAKITKERVWKSAFAVALAWSVVAHAAGADLDDSRYSVDTLWSWSDNQLVNSLRRLVPGGE